jgi:RNA polymerase sigma-70 factor (ECF subfamily)
MALRKTVSDPPLVLPRDARARGVAFETLYTRYAQSTFAFFLRKVGSRERAADLNQELYLRLSGSMEGFEGRSSWRTWIFAIARNVLADDLARRYRSLSSRTVTLDATSVVRELSLKMDPDDRAATVLLRERLRFCLRRLSQVARTVIVAHYFRGVTLRELTEILALPNPSGSRAVLIAAQRKLRRCIEAGRGA